MLPRRLFEAIKERDGDFCLLALPGCMGEGTCLDRRANRGHGGSKILNDPANLILACGLCNGAKADAYQMELNALESRGLYVVPSSTHEKTLARVREAFVEYLDGDRYYLISATERRFADGP
jgi:hypothetical protein